MRVKLASQTPKLLLNLLCAASLPEGFWKDLQVPTLSRGQGPAWLVDDSSLSPFPRRTNIGGTDLLWHQKEKERERKVRNKGLAHLPQEALTLCRAHPPLCCIHQSPLLPLPPLLTDMFNSQAPQAFYFMVIDGEQVPIAEIMYSKLSFCWFLIGESPWGFTQPSPKPMGEGAGVGGMVNADDLFPGQWCTSTICRGHRKARHCLVTSITWRLDEDLGEARGLQQSG